MDKYVKIPIIGIETQSLDDNSPDGLCEQLLNVKPKGLTNRYYWVPFEKIRTLKNESGQEFTYTYGIANIKAAFWQIRNKVNDKFKTTTSTSLERLIVLCEKADRKSIDIIDPVTWAVVKEQPLPINNSNYDFTATRINEFTIINVTISDKPYKIYYLLDDLIVEQGWPELPKLEATQSQQIFSDAEITNGSAYGVNQLTQQWYQLRYAYKLYDGSYVKHSTPVLMAVPQDATERAYMVPQIELKGQVDSVINSEFWKTQISGVSVFATFPKDNLNDAVKDGLFYELIFYSDIDKIPQSDWPTSDNENIKKITTPVDNWPLQRVLNIDSFSHHKMSARAIDSYNKRLLLGGRSTDFAKPENTLKGLNTGGLLGDFLDVESQTITGSNESYDSLGNLTTQGLEDYIVEETHPVVYFKPKLGKEIKAVRLISSQSPSLTQIAPHGETLANVVYENDFASFNGAKLKTAIKTRQSLNYGDPLIASMTIEVDIGPTGGVTTNTIKFKLTSAEQSTPLHISNFEIISGTVNYDLYFEATINTDKGEYKRVEQYLTPSDTTTLVSKALITYPDSRATNLKCYIKNGANYEIVYDKELIQHPSNNYSYALLDSNGFDFQYTLGSGALNDLFDFSVNDDLYYNVNEVQASNTSQPFTFDAGAIYRIGNRENDIIQGFGVNQLDISQGQFGQYPLYVFTNESIWALEQSSNAEVIFARIVPIDTRIGLISPHAVANVDRAIVAVDTNYIYTLSGNKLERIDRPISHHPEYIDFIRGCRVAYHEADEYEEIIFSNPNYAYSWYFNMRYKTWYQGQESFKLFINKQPTIHAINTINEVKNFQDKNKTVNVEWKVKTRPLNFGEAYLHKRMKRGIFRLNLFQELENDPVNYQSIQIQMYGYKENHNSPFKLLDKIYKSEQTKDIWIRMNYGSFQTFQIELSGHSMNENSYINEIETEFQLRQTERVER